MSSLKNTNTSRLGELVLEIILCFLPIKEAVRTSILSKDWRYKWTKIPKLAFMSERRPNRDDESAREKPMGKLFSVIHQILLMRQAPIHEFSFSIQSAGPCFEFDPVLLHLSRNHPVKKLSLEFSYGSETMYKLPFSVFSMHHLTDLSLTYIDLDHKPVFSGFGCLTTLYLEHVRISSEALLYILSNCPLLKCLSLSIQQCNISIVELFKCLPMIECLTTSSFLLQGLLPELVPEELPRLLIHLKYFCFEDFFYTHTTSCSFVSTVIKSSPNLEKVRLQMLVDDESYCSNTIKLLEDSDFWFEHLNELEIEGFSNSRFEMKFVKFVLARSPKLKKARITSLLDAAQEEVIMFSDLLRAPRASPVQIIVKKYSCSDSKDSESERED